MSGDELGRLRGERMDTIQLGDFQIHKVIDQQMKVPVDMIFEDYDWDQFEAHADWLAPHQVDIQAKMPFLSFHSFVVQTGRNNVLIDSCIGNHKERGEMPGFHMAQTDYLKNLSKIGLGVEDIDYVMCTHMHADHVGWNTRLVDGKWQPTFPNAMYVFAEREYLHWEQQAKDSPEGPWQESSYYDSVLPVMEAGQASLVDTDFALEDGLWLEDMPGHSPGNTVINAKSKEKQGIFSGDVLHHAIQTDCPSWYTNFCYDKPLAAATRGAFVDRMADRDVLILPAHFSGRTAGYIRSKGQSLIFDFLKS